MYQNRKRIYVYPITARGTDISSNPYIQNLILGLEQSYIVVNKNNPSNSGIIQIFKFLPKSDIFLFNWVENLPDKKGGKIQTIIFLLLLLVIKLSGKKIGWIMHNKISHSKVNYGLKTKIFKTLLIYTDFILTHSNEGITYAKSLVNKKLNINYLPHPISIYKNNSELNISKEYDFIIWGSMIPYKGIHSFLEFLNTSKNKVQYKILIIGKFSSIEYYEQVKSLSDNNITLENRFAKMDELINLVNKSKFVLFTYSNNSVLSSGALMDTIGFNANIIGPNTGAFADLAAEGIISTYQTFSDIENIFTSYDSLIKEQRSREKFINENNWINFGRKLNSLLENKTIN
jgi:beta-1,4-mannosyltransferase